MQIIKHTALQLKFRFAKSLHCFDTAFWTWARKVIAVYSWPPFIKASACLTKLPWQMSWKGQTHFTGNKTKQHDKWNILRNWEIAPTQKAFVYLPPTEKLSTNCWDIKSKHISLSLPLLLPLNCWPILNLYLFSPNISPVFFHSASGSVAWSQWDV